MTNLSVPVLTTTYAQLANNWGRQVNKFNRNKEQNGFDSIKGKEAVEAWMAAVTQLAIDAKKLHPVQLGHLNLAEIKEGISNVVNPVSMWDRLIAGGVVVSEWPTDPKVVINISLAEQIAAQQREAKAEENRKAALAAEEKKKANLAAAEEKKKANLAAAEEKKKANLAAEEEKKKANLAAEEAETLRVRKQLESNERERAAEEARLTKEVEEVLKEAEKRREQQLEEIMRVAAEKEKAKLEVQRAKNQNEREKAERNRIQKENELKVAEQKLKNEEEKVRKAAAQAAAVPGTQTSNLRRRLGKTNARGNGNGGNMPADEKRRRAGVPRTKNSVTKNVSKLAVTSNLVTTGKKILNVLGRENTQAGLKKAYRTLALQMHPNKGGSTANFQELGKVYKIALNKFTNSNSSPNVAPPLRIANAPRNTRVANAKKASNNKENANRANMNKYMNTAEGNGNGGMSNANVAAPRNIKASQLALINRARLPGSGKNIEKLKRNINTGTTNKVVSNRLAALNSQTRYQTR